jgi:signal transduction histidine kinase
MSPSAVFSFPNLDLLSVGVVVAGMMILGVVVLLNNLKNISNKAFFYLALSASSWSIVNYSFYQVNSAQLSLWLLRLEIFFAVWFAFAIFNFLSIFPSSTFTYPRYYKYALLPITIFTAVLTLTPFVFSKVGELALDGTISKVDNGPGIIVFGALVGFLNLGGVARLIKNITKTKSEDESKPLRTTLYGIITTLFLILVFNFIFPAFLNNPRYVPLGGLFIFPFIAFTTYAILKQHLLNIKVIATEALIFVLVAATLIEIVFSNTAPETILRIGVFALILGIGIMLIRSVRREVEQREKLEKLTSDLELANQKLKELDTQKSQFLSFASHDLKSPLNIIKQFATLIADGTYKEPAKVQETIAKIKSTADRATTLVDDFLDIRKIEEGHMDYAYEARDIVSFVRGITEDYATLAKGQKGIEMTFSSALQAASVKMDTTRLRQVIQNLLSNSLKYTEKGWIKVSITDEQKSVLVAVTDSGIGMDKQLVPILFEQFRRDPGVAKKIQGTGLGLYISKQIVIAHGGQVWAESEGKGLGSSFFVRLPKA